MWAFLEQNVQQFTMIRMHPLKHSKPLNHFILISKKKNLLMRVSWSYSTLAVRLSEAFVQRVQWYPGAGTVS